MASVIGDGNGEGEAMGCGHFKWEEGEEERRLHSASSKRQNKERHDGWHLEVEDDQRKLGRWTDCVVGSTC
jgi:hypothetical protein